MSLQKRVDSQLLISSLTGLNHCRGRRREEEVQSWKHLKLPAPAPPASVRSAGLALPRGYPTGPVRSHTGPLCGWRRPFPSQPGGCVSAPSALAELTFGHKKRSFLPQLKLLMQQLSDSISGGVRAHCIPAGGSLARSSSHQLAPRPPPWLPGEVRTHSPVPLSSTYLSGSQCGSKAVPSPCSRHKEGDTSHLTSRRWTHKNKNPFLEKAQADPV